MANVNYKNTKKRKRSTKSTRKTKRIKRTKRNFMKRWARLNKRYKARKALNVANENEVFTRTVYKPKHTKRTKKLIRKLFNTGYSPFINRGNNGIQLTESTQFNKCKWIYRGTLSLTQVRSIFNKQIMPENVVGNDAPTTDTYYKSGNNYCCFYQSNSIYEITNPTNYDMNLVIYDIVYKEDCPYNYCTDSYFEDWNGNTADSTTENSLGIDNAVKAINSGDPISLIHRGLTYMLAYPTATANWNSYIVGEKGNMAVNNIKCYPTDSHLFNIYCRIVRKRQYRLQPGASMTHKFFFKPKKLMNRATFGLKYSRFFGNYGSAIGSVNTDIGIKGLTHGSLFKVWGQVVNSGADDSRTEVAYAPGKITIKETFNNRIYFLDSRGEYINIQDDDWTPGNDKQVEIANDITIKPIKETNLTDADNNDMQEGE